MFLNRLFNQFSASELLSFLVFLPPAENRIISFLRTALEKAYRSGGKLLSFFLL
jgi:hypothetical protein